MNDSEGFAAAGILPFRRSTEGEIELLLAREWREASTDSEGGDKLNFLGGKRWKKDITPLTCAIDRFLIETGGRLSSDTIEELQQGCPLACWSKHSKYVLFFFELSHDVELGVNSTGQSRWSALDQDEDVKRVEWVKRSCIINEAWSLENMHNFALKTVHELLECNVMQHLESISDVASKSQNQDLTNKDDDDIIVKMRKIYDPIQLLRAAGKIAAPDLDSVPENPKLHQLKNLVTHIPSHKMENIRLKLNPDRLSKIIKREPSEKELRIPVRATELLNMIIAGKTKESEFKKAVEMLRSDLDKLSSKDKERSDDASEPPDDVEQLLKQLMSSKIS